MRIIWIDTIDSTNSEVLRHPEAYPSGTVLAAFEQTAGRGQRGNSWFSEPGKNLTFSIVLKFREGQLPARRAHWLNYLMSYAVTAFLEEEGLHPQVKWPNDVYVNRRKICGMLIENTLKGNSVALSVVGVGLNVNQRDFPRLANATSLSLCTGKEYGLKSFLARLSALFEENLILLYDWTGLDVLLETYSDRLFQKGVQARYHDLLADEEFTGIIRGVEPDGRLRIFDGSRDRRFGFKEVSYIL